MERVSVRELKAHASEILHRVREEGAAYQITRRGRPVAELSPVKDEGKPVISLRDAFAHLFTDEQVAGLDQALAEVRREVADDLERLYREAVEDPESDSPHAI